MEEEYKKALEELNMEYKKIYNSNEYRLGRKILLIKYYVKHLMFRKLFKKIITSRSLKYIYEKNNCKNDIIFKDNEKKQIGAYNKNEKIAVYTINIGGYDNLLQPLIVNPLIDYYYVSDQKPEKLGIWKFIDIKPYLNGMELSNVKKSRYLKIKPYLIFKNYKYSIYIDSNIRLIDDIAPFVSKINKTTGIAIHPHPNRDCIYKELKALKITGKGNYKTAKEQVNGYKAEGMPAEYGLFENNVIVREHNNPLCIQIMEQWWNELYNKSERDQLSLTYVLWKNKIQANDIGVICESTKNNGKIQVIDHIEEYKK